MLESISTGYTTVVVPVEGAAHCIGGATSSFNGRLNRGDNVPLAVYKRNVVRMAPAPVEARQHFSSGL